MSRLRWALAALGAAGVLGGGAAGAVLYTNLALAAAPAASVVTFSGGHGAYSAGPSTFSAAPLMVPAAAASPAPSPGTHTAMPGGCKHMSSSSSSSSSTKH
jgi:hypothetical protein